MLGNLLPISMISYKAGVFPVRVKIAQVTPVFPAADGEVSTDFRSISLLPQVLKISEKIFVFTLGQCIYRYELFGQQSVWISIRDQLI